jgi:hypothetical protein
LVVLVFSLWLFALLVCNLGHLFLFLLNAGSSLFCSLLTFWWPHQAVWYHFPQENPLPFMFLPLWDLSSPLVGSSHFCSIKDPPLILVILFYDHKFSS